MFVSKLSKPKPNRKAVGLKTYGDGVQTNRTVLGVVLAALSLAFGHIPKPLVGAHAVKSRQYRTSRTSAK